MNESRPRLFTVAEIAVALRVSNMTIYRMINSGVLSAVKISKSFRVTERDLREYLEQSPTHDSTSQVILERILHNAETKKNTE